MSRRSSRRVTNAQPAGPSKASRRRSGHVDVDGRSAPGNRQALGIEQLEPRVLFTTIGDPMMPIDAQGRGVFDFQQGSPAITVRVTYYDVVAELVGVSVSATDGVSAGGDLIGASATPPANAPNLFQIYIAASDLTSYITVSQVDPVSQTTPRVDEPFGGSAGPFLINNASNVGLPQVSISPSGGSVLIGDKHNGTNDTNVPVVFGAATDPLGVYPGSGGAPIEAGIQMAPTNILDGTPNDIGKILIAGSIFGSVNFPAAAAPAAPLGQSQGGNVGLFYAGAILTGDATGVLQGSGPASAQAPNFVVGGDLRDLITDGDIGGDIGAGGNVANSQYFTGFYATIAGTLGEDHQNQGGLYGDLKVEHSPTIYGLPETLYPEQEIEYNNQAFKPGEIFSGKITGTPQLPAPFTNDSAANPQYLSSLTSANPNTGALLRDINGNVQYSAYVSGIVQHSNPDPETDDFYSVPLLAGQTITITLTDLLGAGFIDARLVDPSGRVVASNENNVDPAFTLTQPFSYTADRPGEYSVDVHFNASVPVDNPYDLEVDGLGNLGIGTVSTATNIYDGGYDDGYEVDQGDLGAFLANDNIATGTAEELPTDASGNPISTLPPLPATSINVENGSLRELQAGSIGVLVKNVFGDGPYLLVPNGQVGLVSATDGGGILDLETNYDPLNQYGVNSYDPGQPVGGNFQTIDGAGQVYIDAATNQGIGQILAGEMSFPNSPGFIDVNADNAGNDGIIDLIDVAGDLGTISAGGPAIVTHTGGDVRYMVVGGTVYEDSFFGGGFPSTTEYGPGEVVNVTDDSGTSMSLTPTGLTQTIPILNPDGTTGMTTTGPQVTLQTYGIRDKGGVVVLSATSTGGLTITSNGTLGSNNQAEIGTISITGNAPAVIPATAISNSANGQNITSTTDANGEPVLVDTTNTPELTVNSTGAVVNAPLFGLTFNGSASSDVLHVTVNGNANFVENLSTNGEIGGITAGSVGTILSYGTLGLLRSYTGAALLPLASSGFFNPGGVYPFVDQRDGIATSGDVYAIQAYQGLGNLYVGGSVEQVTANSNGTHAGQGFEGIDAPVVATGALLNVSIGQGLLPTGSGLVGFSGLFADGDIGTVTNNGVESADIRGAIVSVTGIDNISLVNGSIIGSVIAQVDNFAEVSPIGPALTLTSINNPISSPIYTLKTVSVGGNGGIIGTFIIAANIQNITVGNKGFGFLESEVLGGGDSVINNISAGGYGIRDVTINAGASLNSLIATGNGSEVSVQTFGTDVRQSESTTRDPYFNSSPNKLTDLDAFLGTSSQKPIINGVTDTGAIEDVTAFGNATLGTVSAYTIRTAQPLVNTASPLNPNIPVVGGTAFPMTLSFAAGTGTVMVRGIIDGLQLTTGNIKKLKFGGSVSRCGIAVAGPINKFIIHGNYGQSFTSPLSGLTVPDSYIDAIGVNGSIGYLKIFGSLDANVTANSRIGNIIVGQNVVGSIDIKGQTNGLALNTIRIGGTLADGSLTINGSAKNIITSGSLGSIGDSLTVTGNLGSLTVGANHHLGGSDLALNLNVQENLGKLNVYGRIDGSVTVAGNLNQLMVRNDGSTNSVISGAVTVNGKLGTAHLIGGNLNASVNVNGDINNFTLINGSVLAGETITSRIGTLKHFKLVGGTGAGLFGSIDTPNGLNESIDVGGNFGDGTDAASILAYSASKIRIRGDVSNHTSITTTATLKNLEIDGNVGTTATITGHPIVKQKILGQNLGTIVAQ